MSNLFVRNDLVTNHDSQHMVSFIETGSDKSSQPKLFPLCRLKIMFIWVALLVSCLANIWSQMRRILCNCFGCRNIKPGPKSFEIADSRASEKEDGKQCIAESDDVNSPSLGYLIPKPVSKYRLKYIRCTISPDKDDHIVGASPSNPIIIEDHHVEPSG